MPKLLEINFSRKLYIYRAMKTEKSKLTTVTLPDFYKLCLLREKFPVFNIQGGSNMTGTICV
jgi:hypothetical protein